MLWQKEVRKISIFSDYKCGAMSDDEFRSACAEMNRQDRWEREHEFDDDEEEDDDQE